MAARRRKPDASSATADAVVSASSRLDRLLEHRLRLTLSVLLSRHDEMTFSRLKELTGETDGNLGANLRKLESASYIQVRKEFAERKPVSWYRLTRSGRQALRRHLDGLSALIAGADAD